MSDIINVQNVDGKLLVSSLDVSKNFNKEHKHVLEKIDTKRKELNKSVENSADIKNLKVFFLDNFLEDCYIDDKGREQRQILLTRDGFSFITMGFTGIKADTWKLKYIEVFNKMEQQLRQQKQLSPMEQLKLQYKVLEDHEQKFKAQEKKIVKIQEKLDDLPLQTPECDEISKTVKKVGVKILGGIGSKAYKNSSLRAKVYSDIHRQLKREFDVNSYKAIKRKYLDNALRIIENYNPPFILNDEISLKNTQFAFSEVKDYGAI